MLLGKKIRLNRLISDTSGRYLGVTVDHAMARGVLNGLEDIRGLVKKIVDARPDELTMHKGIADSCFYEFAAKIPLVLKLTTFGPTHPKQDVQVSSVEDAVSYGADAVSAGCIVLGQSQPSQIEQLGRITDEAHTLGIPVVAHIYPRGPEKRSEWNKVENVMYAARLGAELGVDIIKTTYTGDPDSFSRVVACTPAKVAVAGGDSERIEDVFATAHGVIAAGGVGITFGRSVFQSEDPTAFIKTLSQIVHNDMSVNDALCYYKDLIKHN